MSPIISRKRWRSNIILDFNNLIEDIHYIYNDDINFTISFCDIRFFKNDRSNWDNGAYYIGVYTYPIPTGELIQAQNDLDELFDRAISN